MRKPQAHFGPLEKPPTHALPLVTGLHSKRHHMLQPPVAPHIGVAFYTGIGLGHLAYSTL